LGTSHACAPARLEGSFPSSEEKRRKKTIAQADLSTSRPQPLLLSSALKKKTPSKTKTKLRLPLQGRPDRRLRSRQVQPPLALHPQRVLPRVQVDHRRRVRDALDRRRRQDHQGADLGHRGAGAVPCDHQRLLPRRRRGPAGLRHHEGPDVRERRAVAQGAARPRRRQHRDLARRQQG